MLLGTSLPPPARKLYVEGSFGAGKFSGLHTKTCAVDRRSVVVGSFNLEQRSARLITELGAIIDGATLAGTLATVFVDAAPLVTHELRLTPGGTGAERVERHARPATRIRTRMRL